MSQNGYRLQGALHSGLRLTRNSNSTSIGGLRLILGRHTVTPSPLQK